MQDLGKIARGIEDAFNRSPEDGHGAIGALFAPIVQVKHEPSVPQDGPMPREMMRKGAALEMTILRKAIENFRAEAKGTVKGDRIFLDIAYLGTLKDGAEKRFAVPCEFGLKDGAITDIVAHVPEESGKFLMAIMAEGGLTAETFAAQLEGMREHA